MDGSEAATFGKVDERSSINAEEQGGTDAIPENNLIKGRKDQNYGVSSFLTMQ